MIHSSGKALIGLFLLFNLGLSCLVAQDQPPPAADRDAAAEIQAIRKGSQAFVTAFNERKAKSIAALWAENGEYVDETAQRFVGRDAIEQGYSRFFAEHPTARLRIVIDSLRLLSDSAAIEDGRAILEPPPTGAPGTSHYSVVHVKVGGQWLMATVRDTWVENSAVYEHISDLDWLIGSWRGEEHGATTEAVCRWVANKSFVERTYTVTQPDGTSTSGVQLIGWNPQAGHIQSWNFSSDGGHAVGVWTPRTNGWSAEIRGMTGDGTATSAVNLLTRLDDQAYVWQSVQRTIGDTALRDTDEVVIKRQPSAR